MDFDRYWWLYGLIAIAALFGSLQGGINMGFNYAVDNAEDLGLTKIIEKSVVKEVPVERIVYRDSAPTQVVREVQVSGNTTIPQKVTYEQVVAWLKKDGTNTMPYDSEMFNCVDYAATVNNNAEVDGLKCGVFYIKNGTTTAHMGVVFDTIDKGLVYAEPQFDWILPEIKVGMVYHQIIADTAKKYNSKFEPTEAALIKKVVIIW